MNDGTTVTVLESTIARLFKRQMDCESNNGNHNNDYHRRCTTPRIQSDFTETFEIGERNDRFGRLFCALCAALSTQSNGDYSRRNAICLDEDVTRPSASQTGCS